MAKICANCNKKIGLLGGLFNLKDGFVCSSCFVDFVNNNKCNEKQFDKISNFSSKEFKENFNGNLLAKTKYSNFKPTINLHDLLEVDEKNKLLATLSYPFPLFSTKQIKSYNIFSYEDIISYNVIEDNNSITKGGKGQALTGGLLFGNVGAVVGGTTAKRTTKKVVTDLKIKINLKSQLQPIYINLIDSPTYNYLYFYSICEEITSTLENIINQNKSNINDIKQESSGADELRKFKQLLDDGIITKEEFENKKKQILGL